MSNDSTIFSVTITKIRQVWTNPPRKPGPSTPLTFHFCSPVFSLTIIFSVTSPCLSHLPKTLTVPSPHVTVLSNTRCRLSHTLHVTTWRSHTLILFCFLLIRLCRSHSPCQSVSHSLINIFFFLFLGCLTPHTHFASLVSRTQATRTVMSSMRSWILQLWPPLPAHEAPLTLARGILSSMQPSSLAHTSACHYRPFPSDFGLKVHRPMNSFPRLTPPLLPFYAPRGFLVCLPLQPFCFLSSPCSASYS